MGDKIAKYVPAKRCDLFFSYLHFLLCKIVMTTYNSENHGKKHIDIPKPYEVVFGLHKCQYIIFKLILLSIKVDKWPIVTSFYFRNTDYLFNLTTSNGCFID